MSDARFLSLAPDAALAAAEAVGLRPTGHVAPLTCLENRVYDLRLEDARHVVLKFYRPGRWTPEAILEEHRFLADLRDAEVPVCAPLVLPGGSTLAQHAGICFAVWPRTGGRSPDELSDAELAMLGRLLARIHAVGAAADATARPRLDATSRVREPLAALEERLSPACARRYRQAALAIADLYDERSHRVPLQRIHGDCHRGNLLRREVADGAVEYFFLDFDDFCTGPAVQDVWMLLPGRDAEGLRQRLRLIDAYRELRDFDDAWLDLVEPLRALRFVWYAGWIARRIGDPVFPDAFPHFGSEEYWENETRDLEEQLARLRRGVHVEGVAAHAGPGDPEAEPELTNADFFWDLEKP